MAHLITIPVPDGHPDLRRAVGVLVALAARRRSRTMPLTGDPS